MVFPWKWHVPAIWWCLCLPEHLLSSMLRTIAREVVCNLVVFLIGWWFCGCLRPNWHWSNMTIFVKLMISWISACFHIPEEPGFSIVKCLPFSIWILHRNVHSFSCSLDCSCIDWMLSKLLRLLPALNLFHEHQGAHSGATQMCLGRCLHTIRSNSNCPWCVDKSPCSLVNLLANPPCFMVSSAKRLFGWAYTSRRSIPGDSFMVSSSFQTSQPAHFWPVGNLRC